MADIELNATELATLLDIGSPMLFLDNLVIEESFKHAKGSFLIGKKNIFLINHLRGSPVMPGLLLTEILAQSFMGLLYSAFGITDRGFLVSAKTSFKSSVALSDCPLIVYSDVEVFEDRRGRRQAICTLKGKDKLIVKAELTHVMPSHMLTPRKR
ncbi:hypothetical protein N9Y91_01260 [Alphaproteobacteria bacterium]|nr:hypothetical protein [Alphaproteobacteria bacterium]